MYILVQPQMTGLPRKMEQSSLFLAQLHIKTRQGRSPCLVKSA